MAQTLKYQTINPATGEEGQEFPLTSDGDLQTALRLAQETYDNDWKLRPARERGEIVSRAGQILREKKDEYAALITWEMGKLTAQAYGEVALTAAILEYYGSHAEAFLKPRPVADAPGAELLIQPIGPLLAIEPWNFPYYQLARVAGPQLVAGNVVLAKHAPSVPQCAIAFAKLFEEAGAPNGVWTNVFIDNSQASTLIAGFRIRGVAFTGSEAAGASIGEQAGRALKKVVLELGGSDPFIILQDADLDEAIQKAAAARLTNMGQACIGSKRFIVVGRERGEAVIDGMKTIFEGLKAGDPASPETTLGPIVNEKILGGLLKQVEEAEKAGARIVTGGKRIDRPGCYMEPTIITDIQSDNPLFEQETFGPIASVYVVDTEDEAIEIANGTPFGLGSSVFSADLGRARQVADRIDSGMVFVNSGGVSMPQLPFGGVKNSGLGRELSELGIHEFVNRKLIRVNNATK